MNLLPIYVHKGEILYNKEGFPQPPNQDDMAILNKDGDIDFDLTKQREYEEKLQSSIDKALRFEISNEKLWFDLGINILQDGAYKLPDGWRVVEQWQFADNGKDWFTITESRAKHYQQYVKEFSTRLIARLVPVEKQEKTWRERCNERNCEGACGDVCAEYQKPIPEANTTASDNTPSPVKTAEEILSTVNNAEWTGEGEPLFSYDQVIEVMNVYASQFRGEMTTK